MLHPTRPAVNQHVSFFTGTDEQPLRDEGFAPAGFPDDSPTDEYHAHLEERNRAAQEREDADNDLRAAKHEAEIRGKAIYRLTADGYAPTFEASHCRAAAIRRAQSRGYAPGKVITSQEMDADGNRIGPPLVDDFGLKDATDRARQLGLKVFRLSCAGFPDTHECGTDSTNAYRRAVRHGWARNGGEISGKLIASFTRTGFDGPTAA